MDLITNSLAGASSAVAQSLATQTPKTNALMHAMQNKVQAHTSAATSASGAGDADITSNDFLTLLVTEMKNQDPTQPTDPNAYIQQLVGVNSLQQLIAINQGLTSIEGDATTSTGTTPTGGV